MRCRVCGGECCKFEDVEDVLIKLEKNGCGGGDFQNMMLFRCPNCTHVEISFDLPNNFYDSYSDQSGAAQYFGALDLTEKKLKKLQKYANSSERFLDIGCGTGYALGLAEQLFSHCLGVEPAQNTFSVAKKKGLNVINGYFTPRLALERPISAFTAFQVFEHLEDLYMVLDYAFELLEPGGVGLINVPNGQRILNEGLYHQLTFEHINYFTSYSLCTMSKRAGFEVIELENIPETIEFDLYIQKPKEYISFHERRAAQKKRLAQLLSPYQSVTVWGAGAKSSQYAEILPDRNMVKHLLDFSAEKAGKFVTGIPVPVEQVSEQTVRNSPVIVIFASSYNEEIIQRLRKNEGYQGEIIYFEGTNVLSSKL